MPILTDHLYSSIFALVIGQQLSGTETVCHSSNIKGTTVGIVKTTLNQLLCSQIILLTYLLVGGVCYHRISQGILLEILRAKS